MRVATKKVLGLATAVMMTFSGGPVKTVRANELLRFAPPAPPKEFQRQLRANIEAPLDVAKVFGRSNSGCIDADSDLILFVAKVAVNKGIDPKIAAATIAIESGCNPLAVSKKAGAIGMTQVMPSIWKSKYDFSKVNLLNREDNIRVGLDIEANYIRQWGTRGGVTHYQGMGIGCETCDDGYTSKILKLAEGR